jgi:linearmycin/streptolysin S transport system ATP-binding protein
VIQVEARGLEKRFGDIAAVAGVSLEVRGGTCVGLLGPNGAGKTTTVSIIAGLLHADAGSVRIDGEPLRGETDARKRRIGLVPQDLALYEELTCAENLRFFGALYDLPREPLARATAEKLAFVGLGERAGDKVKTFSGGMKRRLNLAASLLHDPEILILDEPTVGIDPQSRSAIFDNLEQLKARGKGILYTTHYMEEAERLCDRIVIMDHGKVVADDTLRGLARLVPARRRLRVELEAPPPYLWLDELAAVPGIGPAVAGPGAAIEVDVADVRAAAAALAWLAERGHGVIHFEAERPDLERIFLSLTGRQLRDP